MHISKKLQAFLLLFAYSYQTITVTKEISLPKGIFLEQDQAIFGDNKTYVLILGSSNESLKVSQLDISYRFDWKDYPDAKPRLSEIEVYSTEKQIAEVEQKLKSLDSAVSDESNLTNFEKLELKQLKPLSPVFGDWNKINQNDYFDFSFKLANLEIIMTLKTTPFTAEDFHFADNLTDAIRFDAKSDERPKGMRVFQKADLGTDQVEQTFRTFGSWKNKMASKTTKAPELHDKPNDQTVKADKKQKKRGKSFFDNIFSPRDKKRSESEDTGDLEKESVDSAPKEIPENLGRSDNPSVEGNYEVSVEDQPEQHVNDQLEENTSVETVDSTFTEEGAEQQADLNDPIEIDPESSPTEEEKEKSNNQWLYLAIIVAFFIGIALGLYLVIQRWRKTTA